MKKKVLSLVFAVVLTVGTLTACGSSASTGTAETPAAETTAADTTAEETEAQGGKITVACSATPHAEILEAAKPILAEQGWELEYTVFQDYIQPNEVVDSGDFDANYFQHQPYLDSYNEEHGTDLASAGGIHYEPLGIYPGTETDLSAITDGAVIAIPNDTTNEARALLLLQDNGLITLKADAGINATILDVEENPHNIDFQEMEAAQISHVLSEVSFAVLNGNYAMQAGLNASTDAIAYETSESQAAQTYVNIICVKAGNEEQPGIKALVDVLKSDDIKSFINEKYQGAVVPFED
ncbi:MAG: MetQ/NlpA family ABC transporter substrate-binding protein [Lachnospiraceae bacterium]|nr:MetQ/NlpA family ABC transporter substrate-binding protein [Lachnospiraceae bacterium]